MPRIAVIVRAHLFNNKLIDLMKSLRSTQVFDTYIMADETEHSLNGFESEKIGFHVSEFGALGVISDRPKLLWTCGDYPLYLAIERLPQYDYFFQLEYDVYLVEQSPAYLEDIIKGMMMWRNGFVDYLAVDLVEAAAGWEMALPAIRLFPRQFWGGIFAFFGVSRRAAEHLLRERVREADTIRDHDEVVHCEVFAPSAVMNSGFLSCGSLTALLPGTVDRASFHPGSPRWQERDYLLGNIEPYLEGIRMVHPVVDVDEYLRRAAKATSLTEDSSHLAYAITTASSVASPEVLTTYKQYLPLDIAGPMPLSIHHGEVSHRISPRMSVKELNLYLSFLRNSETYVEFGSGGSTIIASKLVRKAVLSVDSSPDWISNIRAECASSPTNPVLIYANIGPVGDWGRPVDQGAREKWPTYHEAVWSNAEAATADLYLVDGRFRVACFAQVVLRCRPTAHICFHDFASREEYHCITQLARQVSSTEDMSIFQVKSNSRDKATNILERFRFVAD